MLKKYSKWLIGIGIFILLVLFLIIFYYSSNKNSELYGKIPKTLKITIPVSIISEETNYYDWIDVDLVTKKYYRKSRVIWWRTGKVVREESTEYSLSSSQLEDIYTLLNNIHSHKKRDKKEKDRIYEITFHHTTYYFKQEELSSIFPDEILI